MLLISFLSIVAYQPLHVAQLLYVLAGNDVDDANLTEFCRGMFPPTDVPPTIERKTAAGRVLATTAVQRTHEVDESALRVTTPQRGGVWVAGKKISGQPGKFLFVVAEKCATMNDLWLVLDECTNRVLSRVIP
jgi:hypothetical protein